MPLHGMSSSNCYQASAGAYRFGATRGRYLVSEGCDVSVMSICSLCDWVCVSVRSHISKTTPPKFTNFCACCRRRRHTLLTSGFVHVVMFPHNGPIRSVYVRLQLDNGAAIDLRSCKSNATIGVLLQWPEVPEILFCYVLISAVNNDVTITCSRNYCIDSQPSFAQ